MSTTLSSDALVGSAKPIQQIPYIENQHTISLYGHVRDGKKYEETFSWSSQPDCSKIWSKMGRVEIVSITVKWIPFESGASIKGALCNANLSPCEDDFMSHMVVVVRKCNDKTVGELLEFDMSPYEGVSKQVQPVPSDSPQFKMWLQLTGGAEFDIKIKYVFHGMMLDRVKLGN
jgi:hypothetical protein